ncbi:uncharacterized protein J8A68_000856 [[Candida] subhashii]|uniref:VASt domain-containing protein n=1 Tax=[Candida] subhashii TaxID=561895 RepID=A0A8J5R690_9ASCO|nr:uncharacterized protein J8A68_000856 [[Candida] subhashii]KAG7665650.1 hypothetical protein J8A68_000856 [[Candida] subhashii]
MSLPLNDPIEDDEDAWSYSFPSTNGSLGSSNDNNSDNKQPESTRKPPNGNIRSNKNGHTITRSNNNNGLAIEPLLTRDDNNSTNDKPTEVDPIKVVCQESGPLKSSISLQSALAKSAPLDPLMTKEDANSIISKEGTDSNIGSNTSPTAPQRFLNSMKELKEYENSIIEKQQQEPPSPKDPPLTKVASPKIITYRKSKRTVSDTSGIFTSTATSSMFSPSSATPPPPPPPSSKYDTRLYVDEIYKDTTYHFATMNRNVDFHQIFPSVDLTDRLLDDFACALSREILLQGRIYLTENYICFNSNLLGWVTSLVITMDEIIRIEKRSTAGLFPNGIGIVTRDAKHIFASFISRDATFEMMVAVWKGSTGREKFEEDRPDEGDGKSNDGKENGERRISDGSAVSETAQADLNSSKIESYIMTIDGDDEAERHTSEEGSNDESEYEDDDEDYDDDDNDEQQEDIEELTKIQTPPLKKQKVTTTTTAATRILKLKPESLYKNKGPDVHSPTKARVEKNPAEVELADEIIDAPMGVVFAILFGPNPKFQLTFLESHDGSEISPYGEFSPTEEDPTILQRTFTYRRALGFPIGPKSTRCNVTGTIEHLNLSDYAVVVSTTNTPDVPSGGSFSVKTRYVFSWTTENKTNLVISHLVDWNSRSWMKNVIEKSSLSGSSAITKEMMEELKKEIKENTYYIDGPPVAAEAGEVAVVATKEKAAKKVKAAKISKAKPEVAVVSGANQLIRNNIVIVCYLLLSFLVLLLILQLRLFRVVNETNEISKGQLIWLNAQLTYAILRLQGDNQLVTKFEEVQKDNKLWKWTNKEFGKELSPVEKFEFLTSQLQGIYQENNEKNLKNSKTNKKKESPLDQLGDFLDSVINNQDLDSVRRFIKELL